MITDSELARQFAQVMQQYGMREPAPDEWSVQQFACAQGLTYNQARPIIERAVKGGTVVYVGERMISGHAARCYKYVSSPAPAS